MTVKRFHDTVYAFHDKHRRDLPWRRNVTPYRVFVSEIMLQQTQVARVAFFFPLFVRRFPGWRRLAGAPVAGVLRAWQGLGYNRRAKWLHQAAAIVTEAHNGRLPRDPAILAGLPGVGPATAASVAAFAFDAPTVFVETNIRAVFIHHFFRGHEKVTDTEIRRFVEATLDRKRPARWYSALMDYGTYLKREHANPARKSAVNRRQPPFEGSLRQARGMALKTILANGRAMTGRELAALLPLPAGRLRAALCQLVAEGLVSRRGGRYGPPK